MSDEQAFLRAIQESPDDDTPRLALPVSPRLARLTQFALNENGIDERAWRR